METKFTKGEWKLTESDGSVWGWIKCNGKHICSVSLTYEDDIYNSKLISKSPKLLSALARSIDLLKKGTSGMANYEECIALIEYAEQLIKDATTI